MVYVSDAKSTPDNSMDEGRGLERRGMGCGGVVIIIIIISYGEQVGKEEEEQGEAL